MDILLRSLNLPPCLHLLLLVLTPLTAPRAAPSTSRFVLLLPHSAQQSMLLTAVDLPKQHPAFFRPITKEEFKGHFNDSPVTAIHISGDSFYRRLTIVLPLETQAGKVIPIPFIVDTGAPGIMNLGSGAFLWLKRMGMLVEDAQLYLRGKLIWRKKELHRPIVDLLPAHFEVYLDRD